MKKTILLIIVLIKFSCFCQSQKEVDFKIHYQPNTQYDQTLEQISKTEIKYSGSKDFLENLKNKGVDNPTLSNIESEIKTIIKTGKQEGENFPLTIEYANGINSDGKKIIPDGTLIYGHGSNNNLPILDSIVGPGLEDDFRKSFLKTMQSTFSQLSFPERRVKIGDSFSSEMPLSIPIAGITIEMTITTKYKLLNIQNGIAEFDIASVYKVKSNITGYTIKADGKSQGNLFYDVEQYNMTKYETKTKMKMQLKLDNVTLNLNSESGYLQTIKITSI